MVQTITPATVLAPQGDQILVKKITYVTGVYPFYLAVRSGVNVPDGYKANQGSTLLAPAGATLLVNETALTDDRKIVVTGAPNGEDHWMIRLSDVFAAVK